MESKNITTNGITAGAALAMVISYTNWHSIGWAILHGCFSWGYVIYYAYVAHHSLTNAIIVTTAVRHLSGR